MKLQRYVRGLLLGFIINVTLTTVAVAGIGLTYHGRILKPDGSALEASAVQFTIQIRSPGSESCLLYQESQSIDMSNSGGVFSLELGANPGFRVAAGIDGGNSISKVFANQGTLTLPTCSFGSTYTPNSADGRLLYISFNDGSGAQTLSAQKITYVPYAIEAMQVNGYSANQLVRVDSGAAPVLTAANLTTLNELFNGTLSLNTSGNVTSSGTVSAADLHSSSLKIYNGSNYVQFSAPVLSSNVLFKLPAADGSSNQVLKTDGAGNLSWATVGAGSVTSVSVTAPLTSSGTATAPNIALPAATTSQSGYLSSADWNTFNNKLSTVSLADIRSTITPFGGAFANANCTAAQSLYYESSSDSFKCQSISLSSNSGAVGGSTITASTSIVSPIIYGSTAASGTLTLESTSDATKGNVLIAPTGGSVGIGTTTPGSTLDVKGTLRLSGSTSGYTGFKPAAAAGSTVWTLPTADGTSGQVLSTNGSGILSWATGGSGDFKADGTVSMTGALKAPNGAWNSPSITFANSTNTGFYNGGGMIGISANGSLVGTISSATLNFNGSYGPYMKIGAAANNLPGNPTYSFGGDTDTGMFLATTNTVALAAGGIEVLRANGSGNIGIGTTSPSYILSLNGDALRTFGMERMSTPSTQGMGLNITAGGSYATGSNLMGGDLTLSSGISTGAGWSNINFNTATAGSVGTSDRTPSTKMTILGSGNVGIGTTNPTSKLEVNGALKIGTSAPIGRMTVCSYASLVGTTVSGYNVHDWISAECTKGVPNSTCVGYISKGVLSGSENNLAALNPNESSFPGCPGNCTAGANGGFGFSTDVAAAGTATYDIRAVYMCEN